MAALRRSRTTTPRATRRSRNGEAEPGLDLVDRWFRAANYLSVGQIYLLDNPPLRAPLAPEHLKPRLLGPTHPPPRFLRTSRGVLPRQVRKKRLLERERAEEAR